MKCENFPYKTEKYNRKSSFSFLPKENASIYAIRKGYKLTQTISEAVSGSSL